MPRFSTLTALVLLIVCHQLSVADDGKARDKALAAAEERLKAIYEKREFAPATFAGKWLADSSGYLMLESAKPGVEPEVVKYAAEDGKRTVFIGADKLVAPGKKSPLFVQRVTQTPVAHKFCLETRTGQCRAYAL